MTETSPHLTRRNGLISGAAAAAYATLPTGFGSAARVASPKHGGADKFLDCLCCNSKIPAVFSGADPAE